MLTAITKMIPACGSEKDSLLQVPTACVYFKSRPSSAQELSPHGAVSTANVDDEMYLRVRAHFRLICYMNDGNTASLALSLSLFIH